MTTENRAVKRQELIDYIKLKLMVSGSEMGQDDFVSRLTIPHEVVAHLKERIRLSLWGAKSDRRPCPGVSGPLLSGGFA